GLHSGPEAVELHGRTQKIGNPAGANPPSISAVPGVGGSLAQLSTLGVGGLALDFPGQYARFDSAPLPAPRRVTGAPTVRVTVKADHGDAVLFGKVY
ncbi:ABC transporter ATP-binding protein, partial [Streptomyces sp. DT225]